MMKASSKTIKYMLVSSALFINILISGFLVIPVTGIQATQSDILNDPVAYNPEANESASRADNVDQGAALQKFVESVADGNSSIVRGIFVENVLEYPVVQQPATQPGFVSTAQDVVTEFSMARKYGVTGILAHNYLAGASFFDLETGDMVQIIYGDGTIEKFEVTEKLEYQALSPDSASSSFKDLESGQTLSATQMFKEVYTGEEHLTLQTCIQVGSEDSWGRLFIIAEPVA